MKLRFVLVALLQAAVAMIKLNTELYTDIGSKVVTVRSTTLW